MVIPIPAIIIGALIILCSLLYGAVSSQKPKPVRSDGWSFRIDENTEKAKVILYREKPGNEKERKGFNSLVKAQECLKKLKNNGEISTFKHDLFEKLAKAHLS